MICSLGLLKSYSEHWPAISAMAVEVLEPFLKGSTGRNTRGLLRLIILCTIAAAAVASRLFSVIRKSYGFGSSEELNSSTTFSREL